MCGKEGKGKMYRVNLFLFFSLELVHIHSSCADERKICLGAAQEALVDYRVFLFLVVDQHDLTEHRALSSQLSSGSALICRDINKSFSPDSSGGDVYSSCPVCFLLFTFCWQLPLPLPLEGQMCSQLSPNHWPMALQ